jgi:hypothetical protein
LIVDEDYKVALMAIVVLAIELEILIASRWPLLAII